MCIRRLLKPGGKIAIVTDNTSTIDFALFSAKYWGGYHFPRHWSLFNARTLLKLAERSDLEVESLGTQVSPVNWVYSIRNLLSDKGAPEWLYQRFSLSAPGALTAFTCLDSLMNLVGKGALIRAVLKRAEKS